MSWLQWGGIFFVSAGIGLLYYLSPYRRHHSSSVKDVEAPSADSMTARLLPTFNAKKTSGIGFMYQWQFPP